MELISLYSTPIWMDEYQNFQQFKEVFIEEIKEYKNECQSSNKLEQKNNIGGYESHEFLHCKENLHNLFEFICNGGIQASMEMNFIESKIILTKSWVNINDKRESFIQRHVHDDTFSGVFYVKVPENSGKLCIENTSINLMWKGNEFISEKNSFNSKMVKIIPEEGQLYIWPSYLPHYTETNLHDDERISIGFTLLNLK